MNDSRVMDNEIISKEIKVSADEIKISLIKNVNMKGEYNGYWRTHWKRY